MMRDFLRELFLNRHAGMWSFALQRISGLVLAAYIFVHLLVLNTANVGKDVFNAVMGMVNNPVAHLLDVLLVLCAAFHAFNGLRIVAVDFLGVTKKQAALMGWVMVAVLVVAGASVLGMLPKLVAH